MTLILGPRGPEFSTLYTPSLSILHPSCFLFSVLVLGVAILAFLGFTLRQKCVYSMLFSPTQPHTHLPTPFLVKVEAVAV